MVELNAIELLFEEEFIKKKVEREDSVSPSDNSAIGYKDKKSYFSILNKIVNSETLTIEEELEITKPTLLSMLSTDRRLINIANSFYNNKNITINSMIKIIGIICKKYNIKKLYLPKKNII